MNGSQYAAIVSLLAQQRPVNRLEVMAAMAAQQQSAPRRS